MLIGHFAVAFAAKKAAPKASLGTLVFAAVFLDRPAPRSRALLSGSAIEAGALRTPAP
ncbi:MAG TPA: hypothetical protein VEM38_06640 [Burkholderiales bacterium]|nr:hypothetical protein [Burkholderiales bacterium]